MANNGTVSISFVLKDQTNGLKTLALGASDLRKVLSSTVTEAQKLNNKVINFASSATAINDVSDTLSSIQNSLSGLSAAYAAQIEAETKLAVNMRNTMGEREEDIRSIKELCSAQQELGVIGDEVQLAGAQELASYFNVSSTKIKWLKNLISDKSIEFIVLNYKSIPLSLCSPRTKLLKYS